jgi:hypothetical protein
VWLFFPFKLLIKLHLFDSQYLFIVFLPIAILYHTLCVRIYWHKTEFQDFDIKNSYALINQTILAQNTWCSNVFEIVKYGFITYIQVIMQQVFDSPDIFSFLLPMVMLHNTLSCRISLPNQSFMFFTSKTCIHQPQNTLCHSIYFAIG